MHAHIVWFTGRPVALLLCLVACVSTLLSCCSGTSGKPYGRLSMAIRTRLGLSEGDHGDLVVLEMRSVDGDSVEIAGIRIATRLFTPDGAPVYAYGRAERPAKDHDEWMTLASTWRDEPDLGAVLGYSEEEALSYAYLSAEARECYARIVVADEVHMSRDVAIELCMAEWTYLVKDSRAPWVAWEFIEHQTRLIADVAGVVGERELMARMQAVLDTCAHIRQARYRAARGLVSELESICLAELNAGDGRLYRDVFRAVPGRYSGDWAFSSLSADGLQGLADYWDSPLRTRYVTGLYDGKLRLVTLGERVQAFAHTRMGSERARSREAYLEHVRRTTGK